MSKLCIEFRFDYLLIESTGISEPVPVAQTFSFVDDENDIDLSKFSYVDTMVTVVDAFNFFNDFLRYLGLSILIPLFVIKNCLIPKSIPI